MKFTFSGAFTRFFTLLGQNFALFLGGGLIGSILPAVALNYIMFSATGLTAQSWMKNSSLMTATTWPIVIGISLLLWFINLTYLAFVTEVAIVRSVSKPVILGQALQHAFRNALPIFAVSLIVSFVMVLLSFLFLIPGIMFGLASMVAVPARIGQPNLGIWESVQRSFALTKGHRWTLFWIMLVSFIFIIAVSSGVSISVLKDEATSQSVLPILVNTAFQGLISLINTVFVAAIYVSLRESAERMAPSQAASVFE